MKLPCQTLFMGKEMQQDEEVERNPAAWAVEKNLAAWVAAEAAGIQIFNRLFVSLQDSIFNRLFVFTLQE